MVSPANKTSARKAARAAAHAKANPATATLTRAGIKPGSKLYKALAKRDRQKFLELLSQNKAFIKAVGKRRIFRSTDDVFTNAVNKTWSIKNIHSILQKFLAEQKRVPRAEVNALTEDQTRAITLATVGESADNRIEIDDSDEENPYRMADVLEAIKINDASNYDKLKDELAAAARPNRKGTLVEFLAHPSNIATLNDGLSLLAGKDSSDIGIDQISDYEAVKAAAELNFPGYKRPQDKKDGAKPGARVFSSVTDVLKKNGAKTSSKNPYLQVVQVSVPPELVTYVQEHSEMFPDAIWPLIENLLGMTINRYCNTSLANSKADKSGDNGSALQQQLGLTTSIVFTVLGSLSGMGVDADDGEHGIHFMGAALEIFCIACKQFNTTSKRAKTMFRGLQSVFPGHAPEWLSKIAELINFFQCRLAVILKKQKVRDDAKFFEKLADGKGFITCKVFESCCNLLGDERPILLIYLTFIGAAGRALQQSAVSVSSADEFKSVLDTNFLIIHHCLNGRSFNSSTAKGADNLIKAEYEGTNTKGAAASDVLAPIHNAWTLAAAYERYSFDDDIPVLAVTPALSGAGQIRQRSDKGHTDGPKPKRNSAENSEKIHDDVKAYCAQHDVLKKVNIHRFIENPPAGGCFIHGTGHASASCHTLQKLTGPQFAKLQEKYPFLKK